MTLAPGLRNGKLRQQVERAVSLAAVANLTIEQDLAIRELRHQSVKVEQIAETVGVPLELATELCTWDRNRAWHKGTGAKSVIFYFGENEVPTDEVVRCRQCGNRLTHVAHDGRCRACRLREYLATKENRT